VTGLIVLLMGVSGCGKTTVGEILAAKLGAGFIEADRFHPPANVAKMHRGEPLDDEDRRPWLAALAAEIARAADAGESRVVACSALKRRYRETLLGRPPLGRLIYLKGGRDLIAARFAARRGHFMPARLLDSQFAALEEPGADEGAIIAEVAAGPEAIAAAIAAALTPAARTA